MVGDRVMECEASADSYKIGVVGVFLRYFPVRKEEEREEGEDNRYGAGLYNRGGGMGVERGVI
jgi:hypothetical protein